MAKDGIVVEAHIKKSPEVLVKAAKKKGGMAKGVWGIMTMEGQVIHIDPINDKIPGNLTKLAKKFFTARGLKLRMEIVEPEEGGATEETAAEETNESQAAATDEGGAEAPDGGDQKAALEAELAEMQDDIDALQADPENVMFSALQDALAAHARSMDGEDYERGAGTLNVLKVVLEDYEGLMALKRPLAARMEALAPAAEQVKSGDNSDAADQIGRTMREFDYALANNEWVGAAEKLDAIEQLTEAYAGAEDADDAPEESGPSAAEAESSESQSSAGETEDTEASTEAETAPSEDYQAQFEAFMPAIREAATTDDAPLKKKLALLIKGFKSEVKKDDPAKCAQILTLFGTLLGDASSGSSNSGGATETATPPSSGPDAAPERKAALMSTLQNMKTELAEMMAELE